MKKINYNHLKCQNYYSKILILFILISVTLTFILYYFENLNSNEFLLRFILILFLMMFISILIEYKNKSNYLNPIEILNLEIFVKDFLKNISSISKKSMNFNNYNNNDEKIEINNYKFEKYFNKYDFKSKIELKKISEKKFKFYISSISKHNNTYIIRINNYDKILLNILFSHIKKIGNYKLYIKKLEKLNSYKIIRIE